MRKRRLTYLYLSRNVLNGIGISQTDFGPRSAVNWEGEGSLQNGSRASFVAPSLGSSHDKPHHMLLFVCVLVSVLASKAREARRARVGEQTESESGAVPCCWEELELCRPEGEGEGEGEGEER